MAFPCRVRVLANACVLPMTEPGAQSHAIAWDGQVVALGQEALEAAERAGVEPEDAGGLLVLPGFVDAHMHLLHVGLKRTRPDLRGAGSKQEALARVARWLAQHPGTSAVTAEGWDESEWDDGRPDREDLDSLSQRPLVLRRICGHVAVANSAALPAVLARWAPPLVDPATGLLLEEPSLYLNEVLPASPSDIDRAVDVACQVAQRLGVTSVGDYEQTPMRAGLVRAAEHGRLGVRVSCSIYVQGLDEAVAQGFRTGRSRPGGMLQDGGLKVFLDGSIGGHTAHVQEPYRDMHTQGMRNFTDDELDRIFAQAHESGIQIHAHAIGDAAVEQGLQAFERLAQKHEGQGDGALRVEPSGLPHRFEHYEIVHPEQLQRTVALGLWISSQPNFVGEWSAAGGMYEDRLGPRYRLNNRFRDYLDAGAKLAFGSDGMPFGPLFGLASALEHPEESQRLDIRQAIWHYTDAAASSLGLPTGQLAPGRPADLLIVEGDLASSPRAWIVRETILAGATVSRGRSPAPTDDDVLL